MHNHSAFVSLLTVSLVFNCCLSKSSPLTRKSDANANVFKLLLGLYKLNPMKASPVFQSFSENLLMGMGRSKLVLNFESGERVKVNEQVKKNLNEIENMIHTQNKKPFHFEKPEYDLDGVSTENFKADLVLDNTVLSKEAFQNAFFENHDVREDFSALFEHLGSNEIDTHVAVTKVIPVVDTITRYSEVINQNEAVLSQVTDSIARSVNYIGTQGEFDDRNPKEVPMNNLVEDMRDVITI